MCLQEKYEKKSPNSIQELRPRLLLAGRFEVPAGQRTYFAVLLSQGGEFAFVVLAASLAARVIDQRLSSLVTLVVTLSMVTTPLLLLLHQRFSTPGAREELDT